MAQVITYISQKDSNGNFKDPQPIGTSAQYVACKKDNKNITLESYLTFIINEMKKISGGSADIEWKEV